MCVGVVSTNMPVREVRAGEATGAALPMLWSLQSSSSESSCCERYGTSGSMDIFNKEKEKRKNNQKSSGFYKGGKENTKKVALSTL